MKKESYTSLKGFSAYFRWLLPTYRPLTGLVLDILYLQLKSGRDDILEVESHIK